MNAFHLFGSPPPFRDRRDAGRVLAGKLLLRYANRARNKRNGDCFDEEFTNTRPTKGARHLACIVAEGATRLVAMRLTAPKTSEFGCQAPGKPRSTILYKLLYSYRRAMRGSTRVARRAGM